MKPARRVWDLCHEPGVSIDDPIVRNLLSSLRPAIEKPEEAHPLFLDHVALALMAHLAHSYGGVNSNAGITRGGLAPWQERRVKESMSACLNEEVPLSRLASECALRSGTSPAPSGNRRESLHTVGF